jgi:hypothetical protein
MNGQRLSNIFTFAATYARPLSDCHTEYSRLDPCSSKLMLVIRLLLPVMLGIVIPEYLCQIYCNNSHLIQ